MQCPGFSGKLNPLKKEKIMTRNPKFFVLVLLVSLFLVAGCSKVNKENYGKLKMGMEYSEVTALLGSPDSCSESMGTKSCTWGDKSKNIMVNFIADKTVVFSGTGLK